MSVYFQTFVVYGYEIDMDTLPVDDNWGDPYEHEFVQKNLPDDADIGDMVVLCDWRGGDFAYIGFLQAKTNSTRDGEQRVQSPDGTVALTNDHIETSDLIDMHELMAEYDVELVQETPICNHIVTIAS